MSDREKVINDLQRQIEDLEERLAIVLEGQPEIVRCKDCAYALYKEGVVEHEHIVCTKPYTERWQLPRPDNWYCADGERKEDR